jgi:hypothetical protein
MEDLATICTAKKLPRTEVIRQAITAYIATNKAMGGDAFGLWGNKVIDGLKYQKKVRSEW